MCAHPLFQRTDRLTSIFPAEGISRAFHLPFPRHSVEAGWPDDWKGP